LGQSQTVPPGGPRDNCAGRSILTTSAYASQVLRNAPLRRLSESPQRYLRPAAGLLLLLECTSVPAQHHLRPMLPLEPSGIGNLLRHSDTEFVLLDRAARDHRRRASPSPVR